MGAVVRVVIPLAVLGYAVVALVREGWWLSGAVALIAAALLWRRHPRARFTTYILLSAVVMRGLFGHAPRALVFALVVILLMQLPAARRAWPRLVPGARPGRGRDDRMAAP
ncbi:MAG TPA: hypothetical protein VLV15_15010 [Dongiaceae bacterium]|nr:hypothetical protein [Dongiaceae bacterium]